MKLKSNSILAAAAGLTIATANAAVIQVSGYTSDVVSESGTDAGAVTSGGKINNFTSLATTGFTGAGESGTKLVIASDIVTTANGTEFFVDGDANNGLVGNGTLTLTAPGQYQDLQFLMAGSSGTFTATIQFSDSSSAVYASGSLDDWSGGSIANPAFASKTAHVKQSDSTYFTNGLWMRELSYTLDLGDQGKTIDSIDLVSSFTTVGVSGTVAIPEPSSTALLGLGGLALILRRRK